MKSAVGVLAVLLLVSTLALGQSFQPLPFPQEANTALMGGHDEGWAPEANANLPSSMASDEGYAEITPGYDGQGDYLGRGNRINLGSAFPEAVNPVLGRHSDEMAPDPGTSTAHDEFPGVSDPSRNW